MRSAVLSTLRACGEVGATVSDLQVLLGIERGRLNYVMATLVAQGQVEKSGRRKNQSGTYTACIWRAVS